MITALSRLAPVFAGLALGALLRNAQLASRRDGEFLLKVVFYVCLPALMFSSLATVSVGRHMLVLPLLAFAAIIAGYGAGVLAARWLIHDRGRLAVFLTACMIVNSGFVLPFVYALYGAEGVSRIAAFDVVNSSLVFTWVYFIAARGNPAHAGSRMVVARLLRSPPLYAVIAGAFVNAAHWKLPLVVTQTTGTIGGATGFLITLAVGIIFQMRSPDRRAATAAATVRLTSGLVVAIAFSLIFDLAGADRTVVLLLGVAPVGFNTVTFAALEDLDVEMASAALSASVPVSLLAATVVCVLSA